MKQTSAPAPVPERTALGVATRRAWAAGLICIVSLAGVPANSVRAQGATPQVAASPAPVATLTVAEVLVQAEQVAAVLRQLEAASAPAPEVLAIDEKLDSKSETFRNEISAAQARLGTHVSLTELRDLEREWKERAKRLSEWKTTLVQRGAAVEEQIARANELGQRWQNISAGLTDAPELLREQVRDLRSQIAATQTRLATRRDAEVVTGSRVAQLTADVGEILTRIQAAQKASLSTIFFRDAPPFWRAWDVSPNPSPLNQQVRDSVADQLAGGGAWLRENPERLPIAILSFSAMLAVAIALRNRALRLVAAGQQYRAAAMLAYPFSVAFISWMFLTPLPYQGVSSLPRAVIAVITSIALLRLLPALVARQQRRPFYALVAFALMDGVRGLVEHATLIERYLFAVETVGAIALLAYLDAAIGARADRFPAAKAIRIGLRAALVGTGIALIANALGYISLARFVGDGTVHAVFVTIVALVFRRIVLEAIAALLHSRLALSLRVVQRRIVAIERVARQITVLAVAAAWATIVLRNFELLDFARDLAALILTSKLAFGEFALSLGDVLIFALTIAAAFFLSGFVRAVLDDEVLPRLRLRRGVPYAVSTISGYAVLVFGFFAALSAAGVPFGRLAIVVGGLGVGIGFGLQNVVNNFVSGTILLFERPIQIGDLIQMDQLLGRVKRIGLRSSTIGSMEGAEVIVPNANLISAQLVNWTLSDRRRRIELPVGVAYGSDPEQVLALLIEVASQHKDVLPQPPPTALFIGFGASSLDFVLRAWTDQDDEFSRVRSDIAVGVCRALANAGIAIPFPQQDLNVKSIAPEVLQHLAKPAAEDAPAELRLAADVRTRRRESPRSE